MSLLDMAVSASVASVWLCVPVRLCVAPYVSESVSGTIDVCTLCLHVSVYSPCDSVCLCALLCVAAYLIIFVFVCYVSVRFCTFP